MSRKDTRKRTIIRKRTRSSPRRSKSLSQIDKNVNLSVRPLIRDAICHNCTDSAYMSHARRYCKEYDRVYNVKSRKCDKKKKKGGGNRRRSGNKKLGVKLQIKNMKVLDACEKTATNKYQEKKCLDNFNKTWEAYSVFLRDNGNKVFTPKQQREAMKKFFGKSK